MSRYYSFLIEKLNLTFEIKHTNFNKTLLFATTILIKKSVNKFKLAIWLNPYVENSRSPKAHGYHNNECLPSMGHGYACLNS